MKEPAPTVRIDNHLINSLYTDAMLLADEARAYFDEIGRQDQRGLDPMARVSFSCESLKVTTRLMHIIAWLLARRAVLAGDLTEQDALAPSRRLGPGPVSDGEAVARMPDAAQALVQASIDLHRRVALQDAALATAPEAAPSNISPARAMLDRLSGAF
ncbi:DUF1465 family protein [Stakelama pacifica]|uniref:Regulator of CtrA degradation n=1 Tax=Stakelama pacifica TaxID=517720 RepID=A0A4R6FZH2_9SPHN|nr:DUF1465 family protein [Stakelama pacifica]TDN86564.1 regulator of CtrA degradation [Stakelama pacifica]GGO90016.1 hypothetical protein GCM10011329_01340 [Stakelama pacifica]